MTNDDELVAALSTDYRSAALDEADRVMLAFIAKLTDTPRSMAKSDVASLRGAGFDDRSIHDIVVVASYYAFVNRIADGLGVELEAGWKEDGDDRA